MIYFNKNQISELLEHSKTGSPDEVCGILAGRDEKVEKVYKMINKDKSRTSFFMDPQEQLRVMKEIRGSGLDFIGIYHSHPETKSYPSAHDVKLAFYPEVSYVIISLRDENNPDVRSYKILEGEISEEEVKVG